MSPNLFYTLLEKPWLYRFSQLLLAPGSEKSITQKTKTLLDQLSSGNKILDIGCGPTSWLWKAGQKPIGLDLSYPYAKTFKQIGGYVVVGSADHLPFKDNSFDGIWTFGLLHHLPDPLVKRVLSEMIRLIYKNGYLVLFDAVLPDHPWIRSLAWVIRKLDRGRYIRSQRKLEFLVGSYDRWKFKRITYSLTGLEGLFCVYKKD